jgi:probable HAF family extracellular repeat protein
MSAIIACALPMRFHGQEKNLGHHHYKLIDLGTFGGPLNYINGNDLLVPYMGPAQNVNDAGTLIGWADTSTSDPYSPFCFNGDCYVSHAFQWHDGFKTDLGVLPGGQNSATSWISANGLIAGTSQNGELDPLYPGGPENHAVLWRDGNIIDLGTLPEGGYESGAEAVNSRGQVVGWAFNTVPDPYSMGDWSPLYNFYELFPYSYQNRAFLWENGVMRDLGTLGTGTDAYAMAINERGQVIGISYTSSTPNPVITGCSAGGAAGGTMLPSQDPFLWENGQMIDLGTLGGTCGFPSSLNNRGQVVGNSDLAGDVTSYPFLWEKTTGMQNLGTLGGSFAGAEMINDSGEVVGGSALTGDNQTDAFLWDGKMHDLGALNGCSWAFAINSQKQVVGNWGEHGCQQGAFLWENGGPMVDLNTLVLSTTGLSVAGAIEINDRGEIVGSATDVNGNFYVMLLIPCDENHPGVEGCDYGLVDETAAATDSAKPATQTGNTATSALTPDAIRQLMQAAGRRSKPRHRGLAVQSLPK